ncbi:MAG: DF family (seleno)protein [Myxococcota bacterium]
MEIRLLYFEGCPGFKRAENILRDVVNSMGVEVDIDLVDVNKGEVEKIKNFLGSPTILINGDDIEGKRTDEPVMSCRLYGFKPYPERYLIEAAVLRALNPKKILFMCVHNSARSILAEAIARHLAPSGVEILSAGSNPSGVKEEAIAVLKELSIPIEGLYSKSVNDIDARGVNAVITLCAEEVCPVFLGKAIRLHWGLNDPSLVVDKNERIEAFRRTRDELIKRLQFLFMR